MTKRYARARTDGQTVEGEYVDNGDGTVTVDGETVEYDDLLAPCEPSALYCVGRNYAEKIDQMEYEVPDVPDFFIKPSTSVLAPGDDIVYPDWTDDLTYAGELAAVIGERCHDVSEDEASEYVQGYTIMNDLDALDQERRTARKAFDGSAPLGPCVADIDPSGLEIETYVGGEKRQDANTDMMIFGAEELVSFMSKRFTLREGDVVAFGSPANPGGVERGDEVEITYEGVGTLRNRVV
jgi:2-keto-4-pentenoate hydratase/2-oxohepta-3-ene-1,7-dioic acid hydratase in catechol pathway